MSGYQFAVRRMNGPEEYETWSEHGRFEDASEAEAVAAARAASDPDRGTWFAFDTVEARVYNSATYGPYEGGADWDRLPFAVAAYLRCYVESTGGLHASSEDALAAVVDAAYPRVAQGDARGTFYVLREGDESDLWRIAEGVLDAVAMDSGSPVEVCAAVVPVVRAILAGDFYVETLGADTVIHAGSEKGREAVAAFLLAAGEDANGVDVDQGVFVETSRSGFAESVLPSVFADLVTLSNGGTV